MTLGLSPKSRLGLAFTQEKEKFEEQFVIEKSKLSKQEKFEEKSEMGKLSKQSSHGSGSCSRRHKNGGTSRRSVLSNTGKQREAEKPSTKGNSWRSRPCWLKGR